jgi:hypothetical protein
MAVGVPDITPVPLSRLTPAGSAGITEYPVTAPLTVGFRGAIACLIVNADGAGYARLDGGDCICMLTSEPPPQEVSKLPNIATTPMTISALGIVRMTVNPK